MVSHIQDHESLLRTSIFDALYCDEDRFDDNLSTHPHTQIQIHPLGHDFFWDDDELLALLAKEREQSSSIYHSIDSDVDLKPVRDGAIGWMLRVIGFYGFNAVTAVLAVNYFDRFITSPCFQKDKPWMGQLAAVACLSIAAKVEENQVPILLDLQVEESKYLFEAKTIQRMELLVLSTLQWKMNPVTPNLFIDHIVRRFELMNNLNLEFLKRCEAVILSVITDCRLGYHLPSVIAAATIMHVIRETGTCDAMDYQNKLMTVLRTSMEIVNDCYKVIIEASGSGNVNHTTPCPKRRHGCVPSSPSGVIDAYLSSDNSVDLWASPTTIPLLKRSRIQ